MTYGFTHFSICSVSQQSVIHSYARINDKALDSIQLFFTKIVSVRALWIDSKLFLSKITFNFDELKFVVGTETAVNTTIARN